MRGRDFANWSGGAKQLKARLITADETFARRAMAHYEPVELLAGCAAN